MLVHLDMFYLATSAALPVLFVPIAVTSLRDRPRNPKSEFRDAIVACVYIAVFGAAETIALTGVLTEPEGSGSADGARVLVVFVAVVMGIGLSLAQILDRALDVTSVSRGQKQFWATFVITLGVVPPAGFAFAALRGFHSSEEIAWLVLVCVLSVAVCVGIWFAFFRKPTTPLAS